MRKIRPIIGMAGIAVNNPGLHYTIVRWSGRGVLHEQYTIWVGDSSEKSKSKQSELKYLINFRKINQTRFYN
jgi:hypothetical protein